MKLLNLSADKSQENVVISGGRSMVEMLGVLAIIGVLSVGAIAGYSKAMMKYKANKTIEQINTIVINSKEIFANQENLDMAAGVGYSADDNIVKSLSIIPQEMWSGNLIKSVWGGKVSYYVASPFGDYNHRRSIQLRFYDIPKDICVALSTHDWGTFPEFYGLYVNPDTEDDRVVVIESCMGWEGGTLDDLEGGRDYGNGHITACANPALAGIHTPLPMNYAASACDCPTTTCFLDLLFPI